LVATSSAMASISVSVSVPPDRVVRAAPWSSAVLACWKQAVERGANWHGVDNEVRVLRQFEPDDLQEVGGLVRTDCQAGRRPARDRRRPWRTPGRSRSRHSRCRACVPTGRSPPAHIVIQNTWCRCVCHSALEATCPVRNAAPGPGDGRRDRRSLARSEPAAGWGPVRKSRLRDL